MRDGDCLPSGVAWLPATLVAPARGLAAAATVILSELHRESSSPPPFHPSPHPPPVSSPCLLLTEPAAPQLRLAWLRFVRDAWTWQQGVANAKQTCSSRTRVKPSMYALIPPNVSHMLSNTSSGRTISRNRFAVHIRQFGHRALHRSLRCRLSMVWQRASAWKLTSDTRIGESGQLVSLSSVEVSRHPG